MKRRNGFVSNSSSSSFIIAFSKKPKNVADIQKVVFGDRKELHSEYGESFWSTKEVSEIIMRDLKNSGRKNKREIAEELTSGHFFYNLYEKHIPYDTKLGSDEYREGYKKYREELEKQSNEKAKEFISENKGSSIYIVEYSDNDSELYTTMEHGNIFRNLPHIIISKH